MGCDAFTVVNATLFCGVPVHMQLPSTSSLYTRPGLVGSKYFVLQVLLSITAGLLVCQAEAQADTTTAAVSDADIYNFALNLEYLEVRAPRTTLLSRSARTERDQFDST